MSSTAHTLRPYFVRHWRALAGATGATVLLTAAELAKPWPIKFLIDGLFAGREGPFDLSSKDVTLLAAVVCAVVLIALLEAGAGYVGDSLLQMAGERIMHTLRTAVYAHLQRLSLGFHQRRQKGDLVARVTGDATDIGMLFSQSIGQMAQSGLLVLGMVVVTFVLDPLLGLILFVTFPLLTAVSIGYRRKIRLNARRQREAEGQIASLANEALGAMPVVKAFGSERYEHHRVRAASGRRMEIGMELRLLQARYDGVVGVLIALGAALVIVVATLRVAAGALTPGDVVVFAMYMRMLQSPLRSFAKEFAKAARLLAKADRMAEVLATDETLEERPNAHRSGRARGDVVLEDVGFGYGDERTIVSDVSLEIPPGSRVALIGPSGAGKSTLGALIARFYDPTAGRVLIDGRDARDCSLEWLRSQVGVLLQDTILFTGTVEENVAYASGASLAKVVEVTKAAGAHDFVAALPDGYRTTLGPQGGGLSGGERQRIGIARTLLRDPPILVLDEPTTGLDVDSEKQVLDGLRSLMQGRTTILITHSLELARSADRVVVMEAGRIVAAGPPDEILTDGSPFRRLGVAGIGGVKRVPRPPAPPDTALPHMGRLLDADEMAGTLARTLEGTPLVDDVQVERVIYKPHERITVHYRALVDGGRQDAVAWAIVGEDLSGRVRSRDFVEIAERINGRAPSRPPVLYKPSLDAIVSWLPFDAALPALSQPLPELARSLRDAGVTLPELDGELERVGYKPGRRAVLRLGDHVLKLYGDGPAYDRALLGLAQTSMTSWISTSKFEGACPGLRLTAQSAITGTAPVAAADAAQDAGAFIWRLQQSPFSGMQTRTSEWALRDAIAKAALLKAVAPGLEPRLDSIVRRLERAMPTGSEPVAAHGGFHRERLVVAGGELYVVDFDDMCLAPAALDLASYAGHVARGRDTDRASVESVLELLLEGYGGCPPGLGWHLAAVILHRAAGPFQRQLPDWPERTEAMVATAESFLDSPLQR